jgi:hypothetical protein
MKDPMEVLRVKEQELLRVRKEIDALRTTVRLLGDDTQARGDHKQDLRQLVQMP